MADSPTPEFPHISLRACAFYIILIAASLNTVLWGREVSSCPTFWFGFISLILIQVFQEVWWLRHPHPKEASGNN